MLLAAQEVGAAAAESQHEQHEADARRRRDAAATAVVHARGRDVTTDSVHDQKRKRKEHLALELRDAKYLLKLTYHLSKSDESITYSSFEDLDLSPSLLDPFSGRLRPNKSGPAL